MEEICPTFTEEKHEKKKGGKRKSLTNIRDQEN